MVESMGTVGWGSETSVRHFEFHAISCGPGPNVAVRFEKWSIIRGRQAKWCRVSSVEALSNDSASHQ